ncbi:hypothetical protein E2562_018701 [Oryza meyeriana var. granulata]|uniref:Uncharacterized protein n=1 Tax=Oryza meyeriana var. granulata TaxID=110450 RepID=A0A6G1EMP9_9ORYZ|nr:hypothetical protein E2562_018701 [Oryza meyeriana var. granulata]
MVWCYDQGFSSNGFNGSRTSKITFADLAGPDSDELDRGLGLGSWRSRCMQGSVDYRMQQYCSSQCFDGEARQWGDGALARWWGDGVAVVGSGVGRRWGAGVTGDRAGRQGSAGDGATGRRDSAGARGDGATGRWGRHDKATGQRRREGRWGSTPTRGATGRLGDILSCDN